MTVATMLTRYVGVLIAVISCAIPGHTDEPADRFLSALRERGYTELALQYLDRMESNPAVALEFKSKISYEQGVTLVKAALADRNLRNKQQYLDRAQAKFGQFRDQNPRHPLAVSARGQLGNIIVERARISVLRADRLDNDEKQKGELLDESRQLFDKARGIFDEQISSLRKRLQDLPTALSPKTDASLIEERDRLRAEYVQAQFVVAMLDFEKASTFSGDSQQRKKALQRAEEAFGTVAQKYRRRIAGLSAVLYQGRCRQELHDYKTALGYYQDLLTLPDNDASLRPLKTKALRRSAECWLQDDLAEYELVISQCEPWLAKQRPNEVMDPDWLAVKLALANAFTMKLEGGAGRDKGRLETNARRLAVEVAKHKGEFQKPAQELLARLGRAPQEISDRPEPRTFIQARDQAKEAMDQRSVAARTYDLLNRRLPKIVDSKIRQDVRRRLEVTKQQMDQNTRIALDLLQSAARLADEETAISELNAIRSHMCSLHYSLDNHYEAAVIGEFLARRYPTSSGSRQAALIAMASRIKLYGDGQQPGADSHVESIRKVAELIVRQWKNQPEADEALTTLVTLAIKQGSLEQAEQYVHQMSDESAKRGMTELKLGQAFWDAHANQTDRSAAELKKKALTLLENGIQHARPAGVDPMLVRATLSLAQNYVNEGRADAAIKLLTDPRFGPRALADQGHPAMAAAGYSEKAYTLAILAHLGALPTSTDPDLQVDHALRTLETLQNSLSGDATGRQRLIATYVALARDLQRQINNAPANSRPALSRAFERFLDQAAASSSDISVLNWAADSYTALGRGLNDRQDRASGEAKEYFTKAISLYKSVLQTSRSSDASITPEQAAMVRLRLATTYREMGEFQKSIDGFADILSQRENHVYVQMEAARTFQQWGNHGRHDAYLLAIQGDRFDKRRNRNLIWGFGRISKLLAGNQKLKGLFYEARYNLAECRFQYALQQPSAKRPATLRLVKQDIIMTAKLYSGFAESDRRVQFNSLLKLVQQNLGEKATGLSP